jgi:hypothetical protein
MKKLFLGLILCGPFYLATALADEMADRAAVVEMVQTFFDAMTDRNVEGMRSLLTPDGHFFGYRESSEGLQVMNPTHQRYLEGLADGDSRLIERFWDPEVLLHDRMAVVWTPYDLFVDGTFSHCGIDSFSFLKTDRGWRITGIVFSMETEDCPESPLGPLEDSA